MSDPCVEISPLLLRTCLFNLIVCVQLPAIESILKAQKAQMGSSPIYVVVICPTRELASQVAAEAKMLTTFQRGLGVQVVIGGTNMASETKRLEKQPCQVSLLNHLHIC